MKILSKQLLIRIDDETDNEINAILNSYTRQEYENKSLLVREALKIGLKQLKIKKLR